LQSWRPAGRVAELGSFAMKATLAILLSVTVLSGCGRNDPPRMDITPDDVAWATDVHIAKWNLRMLTSKPVYSVGIVLLGPTNNVIKSGPWVGNGRIPLELEQVSVALRGDELKLRCGGSSVNWRLPGDFKRSFWYGASLKPSADLLPIASDANASALTTEGILRSTSSKLCLKICTEPWTSGEPDGAANRSQPAGTPTNLTRPAVGSGG